MSFSHRRNFCRRHNTIFTKRQLLKNERPKGKKLLKLAIIGGGGSEMPVSKIDEKTGMSFTVKQWGFASGGPLEKVGLR